VRERGPDRFLTSRAAEADQLARGPGLVPSLDDHPSEVADCDLLGSQVNGSVIALQGGLGLSIAFWIPPVLGASTEQSSLGT
jgi:hypothetical protein